MYFEVVGDVTNVQTIAAGRRMGLALILGGTVLWAGVPAMAETRPGRAIIGLGLQNIRERVQGWDSRENGQPDNNEMQAADQVRASPGERGRRS